MRGRECRPRLTEKQAHDSRAELHMRFALSTVHVIFRNITDVMQPECGPQATVPGKAVQLPPSDCQEPGMQNSAMRTVQNGSCSNSHLALRGCRALDGEPCDGIAVTRPPRLHESL